MPARALLTLPVSLGALLLAACGPDTTTTVYVDAKKLEGTDPTASTVTVQIGDTYGHEGGCPSVGSGSRLTVNGEPVELQYFGGTKWTSTYGFPSTYCERAQGVGVAHASADGIDRIVLQDGWTKVVDIEVRALLAERRLELVTPADGIIHPDSDVTLRWVPDTDQLYFVPGDVVEPAGFGYDTGGSWLYPIESYTLDLPLIHFHMSPSIADGTGYFDVNPRYVEPLFLKCAGQYTTCNGHELQGWVRPTVDVTVSST